MTNLKQTPWMILIIGIGFLTLMVWSAYRASVETSPVTDRDYYSHGLRYNETLLERRAAASLGWQTSIQLGSKDLVVQLVDQEQQPVRQAKGRIVLFANGTDQRIDLALAERSPGHYVATFPTTLSGERTAELSFERDGARLSKRLLVSGR